MDKHARMIILPRAFVRRCRGSLFAKKVADSTGAELTGGNLLMRTLIVRRLLLRNVLGRDEQFVGLLLPPSVAGVVANAAIALSRRTAVNLNYTFSREMLDDCIERCGIRHVLTSRKVIERFGITPNAELTFIEDFKDQVTEVDKLVAAAYAYLLPARATERLLDLDRIDPKDLFALIFTSGSTGRPKGVMLTHGNVGSNVAAIEDLARLTSRDVVCGILPFFHSMGFTITLWAVLALGVQGAYHFTPLDPLAVGRLCKEHGVTILGATPTFLRSYMRRCSVEDFATLDLVVTGGEKLPDDLLEAFEEKYGVRPMEGYGTTELSPIVAINVPSSRAPAGQECSARVGTVGKLLPGVSARIVDTTTGEDLGVERLGLLLVKGPNVMNGYYRDPETTAEVLRDGWYVTGDMASIDADGFLRIEGRLSRFSKIGGEMVPHAPVEEALHRLISEDEDKVVVAVSAVPDERKGERLVVLYSETCKTAEQLVKELVASGLPSLWIPSPQSFFRIEQIPVLGTGKLDLVAANQLAKAKVRSVAGD
jgi:acyl-[acyl-carrier-protein]-phospholipid O-acyltransferase / long-chain-fatty-acid--[acyl-carrier-protein] ligase